MADMFADSAARDAQSSHSADESKSQLLQLKAVMDMCREFNRMQQQAGGSRAPSDPRNANDRSDIASRIFTLPKEQEMANLPQPRARADLVGIVQLATDQICSAMGVPSSLVYDTHYSAAAGSDQMSLLAATVQQLSTYIVSAQLSATPRPCTRARTHARTVRWCTARLSQASVLTCVYNDIYSPTERQYTVETNTASFTRLDDVLKLHAAGIADAHVALPLGLKSLGVGSEEIAAALDRYEERQAKNAVHAAEVGACCNDATRAVDDKKRTPAGRHELDQPANGVSGESAEESCSESCNDSGDETEVDDSRRKQRRTKRKWQTA